MAIETVPLDAEPSAESTEAPTPAEASSPRKRGRPPGAKNKPKSSTITQEPVEPPAPEQEPPTTQKRVRKAKPIPEPPAPEPTPEPPAPEPTPEPPAPQKRVRKPMQSRPPSPVTSEPTTLQPDPPMATPVEDLHRMRIREMHERAREERAARQAHFTSLLSRNLPPF